LISPGSAAQTRHPSPELSSYAVVGSALERVLVANDFQLEALDDLVAENGVQDVQSEPDLLSQDPIFEGARQILPRRWSVRCDENGKPPGRVVARSDVVAVAVAVVMIAGRSVVLDLL
jgi:hypothetical protein